MWRRPRLVGGGWVQRAESRWWFRVAVRFGSPWRHPFLRTAEYGIRLFAELLPAQIARHRNDSLINEAAAGLLLRSLRIPVRSPDRAIGTTHLSGNSHDRLRQHDQ
jgi:hypothetical protein